MNSRGRLRTIDGLRGLAALAVVLFHVSLKMKDELQNVFPEFVNIAMSYGYLGVPVFFVISGFVIALSVNDRKVTLGYAGNFALRRSIRLDITYWASMGFILVLMSLNNHFLSGNTPYPSPGDVLLHMFYLQDLFAVDPVISVVYWTLCLEVQLYLFFLLSVWVSQWLSGRLTIGYHAIHLTVILMLGLYSLAIEQQIISLSVPGLFLPYWHYFLIGVLISNLVRGKTAAGALLCLWLATEIGFLWAGELRSYPVAGVVVGLFLFSLWRWSSLDNFLSGRVFQYLGSISYTLYLVHPDIGWKVIAAGQKFFSGKMSAMETLAVFFAAIALAILTAHVFHILFEKPSLRLARQLKDASLKEVLAGYLGKPWLRLITLTRSGSGT
jgi:peptidoglycan/LPS O-acetylase OafA/YrhL